VWDLRSYWQVTSQLLCVAGVENFTDRNYREHLDFRPTGVGALPVFQPGMNFYFGGEMTY
jgi:outer membrane receptor protein involved in Fe transport